MRELMRLANEEFGVTTIDAHIAPRNDASVRLAERHGFVRHPGGDVDAPANATCAYRRTWT